MATGEIVELAEIDHGKSREKWIGVYIGILAVLLAVCAMGGGNASKEATQKNIEAANTWSFFQAKNMRRHVLRLQADELELTLLTQPGMPATAKSAIEAKIKQYKEQDEQLTSDPKKGEGLDELFEKGQKLQAERDVALRRDPYFDYGQAFLQIAIVLASIAIISGGDFLLIGSAIIGALGLFMTLDGFTLAVPLPFI